MNTIISRAKAHEAGLTHYYTGIPCKHGHLALRTVVTRICMECDRIRKAVRRNNETDKIRAVKRASYKKHIVKVLAQKKEYRLANKGKINALNARRKQVVKVRTPAWLTEDDLFVIQEIYLLAEMRSKMLGFAWNVDHIVPLQGENVSGLHVPTNLQVIPALDNIRKKNRYEVGYA